MHDAPLPRCVQSPGFRQQSVIHGQGVSETGNTREGAAHIDFHSSDTRQGQQYALDERNLDTHESKDPQLFCIVPRAVDTCVVMGISVC